MDKETLVKSLGINPDHTVTFKEVAAARYRVNVFKSEFIDGSVVPRTTLYRSYYIEHNVENNTITDLTI